MSYEDFQLDDTLEIDVMTEVVSQAQPAFEAIRDEHQRAAAALRVQGLPYLLQIIKYEHSEQPVPPELRQTYESFIERAERELSKHKAA